MARYGRNPEAVAIANADKAKVVSPELREWRRHRAGLVAKAIQEARAIRKGQEEGAVAKAGGERVEEANRTRYDLPAPSDFASDVELYDGRNQDTAR